MALSQLETDVVSVRVANGTCSGRSMRTYPIGVVVHPCLAKEANCRRLTKDGAEVCQVSGHKAVYFILDD